MWWNWEMENVSWILVGMRGESGRLWRRLLRTVLQASLLSIFKIDKAFTDIPPPKNNSVQCIIIYRICFSHAKQCHFLKNRNILSLGFVLLIRKDIKQHFNFYQIITTRTILKILTFQWAKFFQPSAEIPQHLAGGRRHFPQWGPTSVHIKTSTGVAFFCLF